MAIKRACTYSAAIQTPEVPTAYSEILVLFMQDQELVIRKEMSDLELSENGVLVTLSQEETAQFRPTIESPTGKKVGGPAYMQMRVYKDDAHAPGSDLWKIDVMDSLSDEIMSGDIDAPGEPEEPEDEGNG